MSDSYEFATHRLVRTSFQPHWKAFFNYKTLFLAQRNDPLGLTSLDQDEANQSEDQAAVTSAHTVNDRARSIR